MGFVTREGFWLEILQGKDAITAKVFRDERLVSENPQVMFKNKEIITFNKWNT